MTKAIIRKEAIARRDAIGADERRKLSGQICEHLFSLDEYALADTILSYASFRSEVITDMINTRILGDGKRLFLPKTYPDTNRMVFYQVTDLMHLQSGMFLSAGCILADNSLKIFSPLYVSIIFIPPDR